MDCSSTGSSVHGILQATILEWVAVSYSRGSSQPRDQNHISYVSVLGFLVAQSITNLPAMQDTWVRFLGQEDPLEKEMANHSSILAWRIPWTEKPGRLQSMGSQESDTS